MKPMHKKILDLRPSLALLLLSLLCFNLKAEAAIVNESSKHFVLVHGACHGAWSWFRVLNSLRSFGHLKNNVIAIDLAASGIDPLQVSSVQSIADYFKPLRDLLQALPSHERVILVGHSFGGLALSYVMERFPEKIAVAVFVSALMPGPKLNVSSVYLEAQRRIGSFLDSRYTYNNGPNNPPTAVTFGPIFLSSKLYQLSPIEDWALATTLMRPTRLFSIEDMSRQVSLSERNYGSVKKVFVVSQEDKIFPPDFARWMFARNTPDEALEIRGSDHMVMISKPNELLALLQSIANKYH